MSGIDCLGGNFFFFLCFFFFFFCRTGTGHTSIYVCRSLYGGVIARQPAWIPCVRPGGGLAPGELVTPCGAREQTCGWTLQAVEEDWFSSFGHWSQSPQSRPVSPRTSCTTAIDHCGRREELLSGRRVLPRLHTCRQQGRGSPFPCSPHRRRGRRRSRSEPGDRHALRAPVLHGRERGAAALISGGPTLAARHQPFGVTGEGDRTRGWRPLLRTTSPRRVRRRGPARKHDESSQGESRATGFARRIRRQMFDQRRGCAGVEPYSEGLRATDLWWGSSSNATAVGPRKLGMHRRFTMKERRDGANQTASPAAQADKSPTARRTRGGHTRSREASSDRSIFDNDRRNGRPNSSTTANRGTRSAARTTLQGRSVRPLIRCARTYS